MPRRLTVLTLAAAAAVPLSAHGAGPGYSPRVDNPWFPLAQGARYAYTGVKDGKKARDVVTVMRRTTTIDGAPCRIVEDRLYLAGRLEERTTDWYSQDAQGNVWYFGEQTAELDAHGHVTSTEGTWTAGVDGARAGIYMPARPRVGRTGRQEYYRGHAEDRFRILAQFGQSALLVQETTPLEPGVVDHKLYARGVGVVLEQTEKGAEERNELVSYTRR